MVRGKIVVQVFLAIGSCLDAWSYAVAATPTITSIYLNATEKNGIPAEYAAWKIVGKCCPVGEMLRNIEDNSAGTVTKSCILPDSPDQIDYSPFFSDYNQTGLLAPGHQYSQFLAVIGDPCPNGKYRLDPTESDEDTFYLLINGSIFAPNLVPSMLAPGRDYCMEYVPRLGLSTFVCYDSELKIVAADARLAFYAVGLFISVMFLVATVFAYIITRPLRDAHGKTVACYSACLAMAFVTLGILHLASTSLPDDSCVAIAFIIQFSFVSSFFWLNAMAIETWQLTRRHVVGVAASTNPTYSNRLFFYYSLWGWGVPAGLVILSIILNLSPTIPTTYVKPSSYDTTCWFRLDKGALPYFYIPVGILVLINIILYTITGLKLRKTQQDVDLRRLASNGDSEREERRRFREVRLTFIVCLVLFIIMGVNSTMELISMWAGSDSLAWSAFDFVNALQGVLVFGLFVLRQPARTLVWRRIQKLTGMRQADYEEEVNGVTLLPVTNDNFPMERNGR